jgi:hypothetical protein
VKKRAPEAPDQAVYRTTAEPSKNFKTQSWKIRVEKIWTDSPDDVVLVANYVEGHIDAFRAEKWPGSPQYRSLQSVRDRLKEELDADTERDIRRELASATFASRVRSGGLTVPPEITWLIADDEWSRDVTIVNAGDYLELWATQAWQQRMRPRQTPE